MGIVIGGAPESDFGNPLGLLGDCHRRIERFLNVIITVVEQSQSEEREEYILSDSHREGLAVALRYFKRAAPLHSSDEEDSLFPRIRSIGSPEAMAVLDAIENLEMEHKLAEGFHAQIDQIASWWLQEGELPSEDLQNLGDAARELREIYDAHIEMEDRTIFPLARNVLNTDAIAAIGREMAQRRGLDPDHLPAAASCVSRKKSGESSTA